MNSPIPGSQPPTASRPQSALFWTPAPTTRPLPWLKACSSAKWTCGREGVQAQTDLLAFVKSDHGYTVVAVEGKVNESFGAPVSTWNDRSPRKKSRLKSLCTTLGIRVADVGGLRHQLLHRTVSAIYEAQRYQAERAIMLVHSFSVTDASFGDFQAFAKAMGVPVQSVNQVSEERDCQGIRFRLAWIKDQPI